MVAKLKKLFKRILKWLTESDDIDIEKIINITLVKGHLMDD